MSTKTPDSSTSSNAPLRCEAVHVCYPGGVHAVRGVDLIVHPGEFISVIGPSGAGKSTLLRCMNRLTTPTEGRILLDDADITHVSGSRLRSVRRKVGMIFQQFQLVERLTVIQNVMLGRSAFMPLTGRIACSTLRVFSRSDREQAMACLDAVGISDKAFQRASDLSGGQKQRVAIARVLAQEPGVILADEPIASLDPRSADIVMETLADICTQRSIPVLCNLHHVDIAKRFGTRVIGMHAGEKVFDDRPDRLTDDRISEIYDGRASLDERDGPARIGIAPQTPGIPEAPLAASRG